MKNLINQSRIFLISGLIAGSLISCKQNEKPEDTKEAAEEQNEAQFDKVASEEDEAAFLVDIAEIDLAEIEIAKLAEQKTANPDVKRFATMLVDDHKKSSAELKVLADHRQITLPTSITDKGKDQYNKIHDEEGKDFDAKFVNLMIDNHEKAIHKMEDASEDKKKDESIKIWASSKIANLTAHLQHAKMLKEQLDKKK